jgi:AraC-like DNA-binding protein
VSDVAMHEMQPRSFGIYRRSAPATGELHLGPTHENPGFELSWVFEGDIEFELSDRSVVAARASSGILLPPDVENTPRTRGGDVFQLLMAADWLEEAADALGANARVPRRASRLHAGCGSSGSLELLAQRSRELQADDPEIEALVHAVSLSVVRTRPLGPESRLDESVRRALEYIEVHSFEPLRIDGMARAAGLTRFVFLRKFKAQVGKSPYQYLLDHRLDRAAELLVQKHRTVLEIALTTGFSDPSRFTRAFTRRFGATPTQYRRVLDA